MSRGSRGEPFPMPSPATAGTRRDPSRSSWSDRVATRGTSERTRVRPRRSAVRGSTCAWSRRAGSRPKTLRSSARARTPSRSSSSFAPGRDRGAAHRRRASPVRSVGLNRGRCRTVTDTPGRLIVDGNNVIGARPDGWWRDRAGATRRLLARVQCYAATISGPDRAGLRRRTARRCGRRSRRGDRPLRDEKRARCRGRSHPGAARRDRAAERRRIRRGRHLGSRARGERPREWSVGRGCGHLPDPNGASGLLSRR